jgi:putative drug exporter of the RND superfamily
VSRTDETTDDTPIAPPQAPRRSRGVYIVAALAAFWFLFGAAGGSYQGKLSEVQKNDQAAYLPNSAESTKVNDEAQKFQPVQTIPGFIVYERAGGLTAADKSKIAADAQAFRGIRGVAGDQVPPPPTSASR